MSNISININIAGRVYPLTVAMEEEEYVRKAAKQINDAVEELEQNYSVRDKQDTLAMSALQFATKAIKLGDNATQLATDTIANDALDELNSLLDSHLNAVK